MQPLESFDIFLKNHHISINLPVVVGVSGWVDSMVLLSLVLERFESKYIHVAHINHSLRGVESDADEILVTEFCNTHGISIHTKRVQIEQLASESKKSIETMGREVRQNFFAEVQQQTHSQLTLLAHHQNDLAETVIFNLVRGSKLRGLSGIPEYSISPENSLVIGRPLLGISKETIHEYAREYAVPYREDASNFSKEYHRNRIRLSILPEMAQINPGVTETLAKFAKYTGELDTFMVEMVASFLTSKWFSAADFIKLPKILQDTVIEQLYREANGTNIGLSAGNIEEVRRFIMEANGGTEKEIGKMRLEKRGGRIKHK